MQRIQRIIPLTAIRPNPRNARTHSRRQIRQIADSIEAVGFAAPVLVDENSVLLAGHGRVEAAKLLGLSEIPAVMLKGLSEAKKRALLVADNKLAANAGWDRQQLALELPELSVLLIEEGFDIELTGFGAPEIEQIVVDFEEDSRDPADVVGPVGGTAITRPGDLWLLGAHRLLCGDARRDVDLERLMRGDTAAAAFLDPPYNLRIKGFVGRGRNKHCEFPMASGEMNQAEFTAFLVEVLRNVARFSVDGAVHYVCIDWRHVAQLIEAGGKIYGEMLNLVVWAKSNAGQGSFYRSQHELIGVFRVGEAAHQNNVQLGRHGRNRTNVWSYPGANAFAAGRTDEAHLHPTVKPIALVADALKDCTGRNAVVLDTFSGSGTTILAAERVGRWGRGLELEPTYVDLAIRRWQAFTGRDAVHAEMQATFDQVATERSVRRDADVASTRTPAGRR